LGGWSQLTDDKQAACLDRIIVYATVKKGKFKLSEIMTLLDQSRLELAFIIRRDEESIYHYCVPLFREMLLRQEVDRLLKHEFLN